MTDDIIQLNITDELATISLNRPNQLNALNFSMLQAIDSALDTVESRRDIRGIIFAGEGRSFAAGADVGELRELDESQMLAHPMPRLYQRIRSLDIPTIAAVQGFALGGGFELALACDLRIAGESAEFGLPELSLGIIPGAGGTQLLTRALGEARALELILTGNRLTATLAHTAGLVAAVVPDDELRQRANALLLRVTKHSRAAIASAKRTVYRALGDIASGYEVETREQAVLSQTHDANEGMCAFIERRTPQFANE